MELRVRAKRRSRAGQHYLRERAAPGGRAVARGRFRVRCCWEGDGVGELRLPGLGAGAARPALGPWTGDGVGDRGEAGTRAVADAGRGAAVSGLEDRRLRPLTFPASTGARAWERLGGKEPSSDDSASPAARESMGEGPFWGEASSATPAGEVKRFAARAWRAKIVYSSRFVRVILAQGPC